MCSTIFSGMPKRNDVPICPRCSDFVSIRVKHSEAQKHERRRMAQNLACMMLTTSIPHSNSVYFTTICCLSLPPGDLYSWLFMEKTCVYDRSLWTPVSFKKEKTPPTSYRFLWSIWFYNFHVSEFLILSFDDLGNLRKLLPILQRWPPFASLSKPCTTVTIWC